MAILRDLTAPEHVWNASPEPERVDAYALSLTRAAQARQSGLDDELTETQRKADARASFAHREPKHLMSPVSPSRLQRVGPKRRRAPEDQCPDVFASDRLVEMRRPTLTSVRDHCDPSNRGIYNRKRED